MGSEVSDIRCREMQENCSGDLHCTEINVTHTAHRVKRPGLHICVYNHDSRSQWFTITYIYCVFV